MNINMITMMRTPEYVHDTLQSLFASDWEDGVVNLIVGSSDDAYVQPYREIRGSVSCRGMWQ